MHAVGNIYTLIVIKLVLKISIDELRVKIIFQRFSKNTFYKHLQINLYVQMFRNTCKVHINIYM